MSGVVTFEKGELFQLAALKRKLSLYLALQMTGTYVLEPLLLRKNVWALLKGSW